MIIAATFDKETGTAKLLIMAVLAIMILQHILKGLVLKPCFLGTEVRER